MLIRKRSMLSGKFNEMDLPITQEQIDSWQNGGQLIQRAFPNLTADQREFLLSGATQDEWDASFKDDNDDDEDVEEAAF